MGVVVNGPQHTPGSSRLNAKGYAIYRNYQNWGRQEICINCFPVSQSLEFITHQTLWDISDVIMMK